MLDGAVKQEKGPWAQLGSASVDAGLQVFDSMKRATYGVAVDTVETTVELAGHRYGDQVKEVSVTHLKPQL